MCIIDCLSTIVFILPLHLDYTKVIILILWWRNFQLEYWRNFQLVSTVDNLYANGRRVFPETDEIKVFVVARGGQPCEPQDAFQYVVAVEATLFRIHVQNLLFALGQMRPVIQYLPPGKGCGDDGRHVERLF